MDETLTRKASLLRDSKLFINPSDDAALLEKQNIFLVLAGKKPLSNASSGHWVQASPTSRAMRADDPEAVSALLDSLGLKYRLQVAEHVTLANVALDEATLSQYEELSASLTGDDVSDAAIHGTIGRLYGFPQTATEAFSKGETLDPAVQQEMVKAAGLPDYFDSFFFSKAHCQEEIAVLKEWYELLRQYDLV